VIAGLGVAAIVNVGTASDDDVQLAVSLVASLACGAAALGGLALTGRPHPAPWLGWLLLLWAAASYALLEYATWNNDFAFRHQTLFEDVAVLTLAVALVAALLAQARATRLPTQVLVVATVVAIAVATGYALSLNGATDTAERQVRALEVLWTLALVGFFATPFAQRALEPEPERPLAAMPSRAP
jgi:hypothetical protein